MIIVSKENNILKIRPRLTFDRIFTTFATNLFLWFMENTPQGPSSLIIYLEDISILKISRVGCRRPLKLWVS